MVNLLRRLGYPDRYGIDMSSKIESLRGLIFTCPKTHVAYGAIRPVEPVSHRLPNGSEVAKLAEDECGNAFIAASDGTIAFLDHETDDLILLAADWREFKQNCKPREDSEADPTQLKSAWIDPEFAKRHGVDAPPDGWIKRP